MQTKGEKTRQHIIHTAKKLFSTRSYDYVSTRMIAAAAGCNQSAISFYFDTKENLCRCVIDDMVKYHHSYYSTLASSIEEAETKGQLTRDEALRFLQAYLQTQINVAFDRDNMCALSFSANRHSLPEGMTAPLDKSIMENVTLPMSRMIQIIHPMSDEKAQIYAKSLSNCAVTYPLTGELSPEELASPESLSVRQNVLDFCMDMLIAI